MNYTITENCKDSFYYLIGVLMGGSRRNDRILLAKLDELTDENGSIMLTSKKRSQLCLDLNIN